MPPSILVGVLWGSGSALGFAFYQIVNRRLVHQASVYRTTLLTLLCSVTVGILVVLWLEKPTVWQSLTPLAVLWFIISGLFHFSLGWTLLGQSQRMIGAARTSPLTSSSMLFSALLGTIFFAEPFNLTLLIGVVLIVLGVYLISRPGAQNPLPGLAWQGVFLGLLTGACWAISPIFFRWGYAIMPAPFFAVLVGLSAGALASGILWWMNKGTVVPTVNNTLRLAPCRFWVLQILAGVIVGGAVFARWLSLVYLPIVSVNALNMLTIPVVVVLAPLLLEQGLEHTGWALWLGTVCVLGGVGLTIVGGL